VLETHGGFGGNAKLKYIHLFRIFRVHKLYFKNTLRIEVSVFLAARGVVVSPYPYHRICMPYR
jgi:hypothetical protein